MTSILIHRKFCSLDFPSVRVHSLEEISENTVKTKKPKGRAIINFFKLRSLPLVLYIGIVTRLYE